MSTNNIVNLDNPTKTVSSPQLLLSKNFSAQNNAQSSQILRTSLQDSVSFGNTDTKAQLQKRPAKTHKILAGIAGFTVIVGIGALLLKGKIGQAKNLAQNIEFSSAKTIEEARAFAKNNLGIKNYQIDNLDVANWLNEGLTEASNVVKGKIFMPKKVVYAVSDLEGVASTNGRNLLINKAYIENIDKSLKNNMDALAKLRIVSITKNGDGSTTLRSKLPHLIDESFSKLFGSYAKGPEKMSLIEKIEFTKKLQHFKDYIHYIDKNSLMELKAITKIPEMSATLKKLNIPISSVELEKLNSSEQIRMLFDIFETGKLSKQVNYKSKFSTIHHELGHIQHFVSNGSRYINKLLKPEEFKKQGREITPEVKDFIENHKKTAIQISSYATSSPLEFVAEVYAGMINGYKYSDEVMALYKKYNGALIS